MARRGENIYKRKDGRWEGRIIQQGNTGKKSRYHSIYGRSYKEVKEKMNFVKGQGNLITDKAENTMEEAARIWLQSQKDYWKYGTYNVYQQIITNYIIPYLGDKYISVINNQVMETFLLAIKQENDSSTLSRNYQFQICAMVRRILFYMNKQYDYCLNVPRNPIAKGNNSKTAIPSESSLASLEQYLWKHCDKDTNLGILIAFHTGIRIGELSALTWKDINLEEEIVYIHKNMQRIKQTEENMELCHKATRVIEQEPKTADSVRAIPIPSKLLSLLKQYQKQKDCYLIQGRKTPWAEPRTIQYRFQSILKKCGIEPFNFHMLRHAFASRCVAMGLDIKALSEILGHSNIQITLNLYVHTNMNQKKMLMKEYNSFWE